MLRAVPAHCFDYGGVARVRFVGNGLDLALREVLISRCRERLRTDIFIEQDSISGAVAIVTIGARRRWACCQQLVQHLRTLHHVAMREESRDQCTESAAVRAEDRGQQGVKRVMIRAARILAGTRVRLVSDLGPGVARVASQEIG